MRSIQRYILVSSGALTLLAGAALLVGSIVSINHETEEVFDASLAQSAQLIQSLLPQMQPGQALLPVDPIPQQVDEDGAKVLARKLSSEALPIHHYANKLAFIIHDSTGHILLVSPSDFQLDAPTRAGFKLHPTVGEGWRSYSLFDQQHQLWVTTAQRTDVIEELGWEVVENVLPPLVLTTLALLAAITWLVKRGLRPLRAISDQLHKRQVNDLSPIDGSQMPEELQTPVDALNAMFQRVEEGIQRERRFTDDAAHELRTPLAAMRIHAQRLAPEQNSTQAMQQGLARMERLVSQLLQLARLEPGQRQQIERQQFDLAAGSAEVIAELYSQALARQMEIELLSEQRCMVLGQETLLQILLRNLLENALRYSHEQDCLQVRLVQNGGQLNLEVVDHGPGLTAEQKQQVFERFYRANKADGLGAGLGLSIVATVIELHQGRYQLLDTDGGGLTVRVELPNT